MTRRAMVWESPHAPDNHITIMKATDEPPFAIQDLADAPPDAVLVVVHPAFSARLRDMYTDLLSNASANFSMLMQMYREHIAHDLVEYAIRQDPTLRARIGWVS